MVVKKTKKVTKMRGSRTHGWGLVHRNSGQRGGAGNAGRGKKAHSQKPSNWLNKENPKYLGKHGFKPKGRLNEDKIINIADIEEKLPKWTAEKKTMISGKTHEINLQEIGYTKLLSKGKATKTYKLTIQKATEKAIKKISAAGGSVITAEKTQ
ncbi:uL15 family ribosomal protein [Candidatus Woesearchaeota archaeon]|nr:uL15 family ribosomal protein [Candidatus Woesearchaeota archaeon]